MEFHFRVRYTYCLDADGEYRSSVTMSAYDDSKANAIYQARKQAYTRHGVPVVIDSCEVTEEDYERYRLWRAVQAIEGTVP